MYVNHFSPRGSGVGCDADASYPTYGERICRPDKAFTPHPYNQVNHLILTRVLVKGGEITCKILK
ncbi:hypothetical protein FA824_20420 [Escherichia coli]|nr:hypothetical protein [Escherichia coli]